MPSEPIQGDFGIIEPLSVVPRKPRRARSVWYKPNHRSFGLFMRSDQMRDATAEVANDIAAEAATTIPPTRGRAKKRATNISYKVKRNAGTVRVSGNVRVSVEVIGRGTGAERAEFGGQGGQRYRNLAKAGAKFGDFGHSERLS